MSSDCVSSSSVAVFVSTISTSCLFSFDLFNTRSVHRCYCSLSSVSELIADGSGFLWSCVKGGVVTEQGGWVRPGSKVRSDWIRLDGGASPGCAKPLLSE